MNTTLKSKVKHLAVIMDGNRRWAKAQGLPSLEGHRAGVKALKNLVKFCPSQGIEYLTVYAFSTENWKREPSELDFLFRLLGEVAVRELENLHRENVRVSFIGDIEAFSDTGIKANLEKLVDTTRANSGLKLQIALNYGSLDELSRALKQIKAALTDEEITNLTEEIFSQYLYTKDIPDPEIIVRTGGERRLSNYLLWQGANSRLVFVESMWPDFSELELKSILGEYGQNN